MKGAVIINAFSGIGKHQAQRLQEEFLKCGVNLDIIENKLGNVPSDLDFCIFLDKDIYTARQLEQRGIRLFNSSRAIEICDDKMLTYIALENKVNEPLTIPCTFSYLPSKAEKEEIDYIVSTLGLPLVLKLNKHSRGEGVFLIKDREELAVYIEKYRQIPHVYQKFISSSVGTDIRVIVIGGKVRCAMRRSNTNDFRSNIELGGVGTPCEITSQMQEIAEKVSKIIGLDYCGIDFLFDEKDEPLVCEVNSNAFFKGVESVSGVNVARIYADHVLKNV